MKLYINILEGGRGEGSYLISRRVYITVSNFTCEIPGGPGRVLDSLPNNMHSMHTLSVMIAQGFYSYKKMTEAPNLAVDRWICRLSEMVWLQSKIATGEDLQDFDIKKYAAVV